MMTLELVPLRQLRMNTVFNFTYTGVLGPEVTNHRLYNDTGEVRNIHRIRGSLGSPPADTNVVVDVLKNGESVFNLVGGGGYIPITIKPGEYTHLAHPRVRDWHPDEYLTVSILSVGTSFPGEDLTINVIVSE